MSQLSNGQTELRVEERLNQATKILEEYSKSLGLNSIKLSPEVDIILNLTCDMFFSNNNLCVTIDDERFYRYSDILSYSKKYNRKFMTITSIEVRFPQFSIGDTVMIVDTGEIAKIYQEDEIKMEAINKLNNMFFVWSHDENEFYWYFHSNQLVKIPQDLLPLLQD